MGNIYFNIFFICVCWVIWRIWRCIIFRMWGMMFVICLSWVVGRIKFVIIIFYIVGVGVDID